MSAPSQPLLLAPPHASALVSSFTSFLTIAIHSLLFHRRLYPPATFLLARAYNLPVHQSRHPAVCAWVRDAVAAVALQIRAAAARRVALAVHDPATLAVVERWVFDLCGFPADPRLVAAAAAEGHDVHGGQDGEQHPVNWTDVHEALRGALRKLAYAGESMPPPPDDSTFSLAIELRDDALAPIQHPQLWLPSEPHLQPPTASNPHQGSALGGASTTPIRSVQAGPLFFECWVEQASRDDASAPSSTDADSKAT
ncbi:HORMA domain-containing protein [Hirsutella rhossiliensis]|uniref:HORMA domain-containing protein n=1 Tax=Hirsutella rhossiliensis TaxID=111463 RepID=A0A9P8MXN7_9HYPO|nr:HORMA domain-containing protein [Hirsutella rhossiliensis]KAH0962887.1 HORMA domain-containing protein [Hirsutella rhossiliensis]